MRAVNLWDGAVYIGDTKSGYGDRGTPAESPQLLAYAEGTLRECLEIERFVLEQAQRQASPLIAQLREAVESIRESEIERMAGRMTGFDEDQRAVVEAITRGIVAKLLHNPSVGLREAAGTPQGERLAAAVRDLFDLH